MDVIVKYLGATTPIPVITLARYVTGTVLALAVWQLQGRPRITRAMLPLHLLRGGFIASMAFAFYWSLQHLLLAEAITLSFIAPLLVPPFAALALGEKMQPRALAAGALGFVGVLVTVQGAPDFSGDRLLALAAVLYAAIAYAASSVVLRARAAADGATIVTLMGAAIPMLILSPIAIGASMPEASVDERMLFISSCMKSASNCLATARTAPFGSVAARLFSASSERRSPARPAGASVGRVEASMARPQCVRSLRARRSARRRSSSPGGSPAGPSAWRPACSAPSRRR
jgi:drug/metabolite transporter (DMT)-like permease